MENIPRTQDLPELYEETSGFYIYKNETEDDTKCKSYELNENWI